MIKDLIILYVFCRRQKGGCMDIVAALFIGFVGGVIFGVFVMAIAVASGEGRRDTD